MQFVSVDIVFHEKQCVVKFLCYTFFKLFRGNTEQFLFHGRIEVCFVRNIEPTNDLVKIF